METYNICAHEKFNEQFPAMHSLILGNIINDVAVQEALAKRKAALALWLQRGFHYVPFHTVILLHVKMPVAIIMAP